MRTHNIARLSAYALALGLSLGCALPALAAYNDVTMTTSAIISVGGTNLNIYGANAVIQSIVVGSGSFDVALPPGATFAASSQSGKGFTVTSTGASPTVAVTCGSVSTLTLTPAATFATSTVTPTATCTVLPVVSSGGGGSVGGGGGGGGGTISGPLSYGYQSPATTTQVSTATSTPKPNTTIPLTFAAVVFVQNLKQGSHGDDVTALQNILIQGGFLSGTPTGYYGALTTAAVKAFQIAHGIQPLGTVGVQTRAILNQSNSTSNTSSQTIPTPTGGGVTGYYFSRLLHIGSKGTDVIELQKRLTAEGLYSGTISGYYGELTKAAVKAFQTRNGIPSAGYVGTATRAALNMHKGL